MIIATAAATTRILKHRSHSLETLASVAKLTVCYFPTNCGSDFLQ